MDEEALQGGGAALVEGPEAAALQVGDEPGPGTLGLAGEGDVGVGQDLGLQANIGVRMVLAQGHDLRPLDRVDDVLLPQQREQRRTAGRLVRIFGGDLQQPRVADRRLADHFMPGRQGELAGDQDGAAAVAILDDFDEIAALAGILVSSSPVGEGYILALCLVLTAVFAGLYFLYSARVAKIVKGLVAVLTRPLPHPDRWS